MGDTFDAVFQALAHPSRRKILDFVKANPGSSINDVCVDFSSSRIAVMKHIRKLEASSLIVSHKEGRVRRLYFNVIPIQMIYERWTDQYSAIWAGQITRFKNRVESRKHERKRTSGIQG